MTVILLDGGEGVFATLEEVGLKVKRDTKLCESVLLVVVFVDDGICISLDADKGVDEVGFSLTNGFVSVAFANVSMIRLATSHLFFELTCGV